MPEKINEETEILTAEEKLLSHALRWWRSTRPEGWELADHLRNPLIGCAKGSHRMHSVAFAAARVEAEAQLAGRYTFGPIISIPLGRERSELLRLGDLVQVCRAYDAANFGWYGREPELTNSVDWSCVTGPNRIMSYRRAFRVDEASEEPIVSIPEGWIRTRIMRFGRTYFPRETFVDDRVLFIRGAPSSEKFREAASYEPALAGCVGWDNEDIQPVTYHKICNR